MRRLLVDSFREGLLVGIVALALMSGVAITLGIPALLVWAVIS